MSSVAGTPSDQVDEILALGRSGVSTIFVSMSGRHPDGDDATYLRWHTFDCRPEQHRLPALRASQRLVSTPACRAARAASEGSYDPVDHVMTYFFADPSGLKPFTQLTAALRDAGRKPYLDGRDGEVARLLPQLEQGLYSLAGVASAPRIKVGADVLPWLPLRGVYLLVEQGQASVQDLVEVPGVAGVWWGSAERPDAQITEFSADAGAAALVQDMAQQITYCFLDEDPVATAGPLRRVLEERWQATGVVPLLAAPFHPVQGYDYDRYLP